MHRPSLTIPFFRCSLLAPMSAARQSVIPAVSDSARARSAVVLVSEAELIEEAGDATRRTWGILSCWFCRVTKHQPRICAKTYLIPFLIFPTYIEHLGHHKIWFCSLKVPWFTGLPATWCPCFPCAGSSQHTVFGHRPSHTESRAVTQSRAGAATLWALGWRQGPVDWAFSRRSSKACTQTASTMFFPHRQCSFRSNNLALYTLEVS